MHYRRLGKNRYAWLLRNHKEIFRKIFTDWTSEELPIFCQKGSTLVCSSISCVTWKTGIPIFMGWIVFPTIYMLKS